MDQATINRYQVGGDLYQQYAALYGTTGANAIASAALSGDRGQITDAISQAHFGSPLDTSTADIFAENIVTDPVAATNSWLNNLLGNTFYSFLKSPWVLLTIVVVLFFALGGWVTLKKQVAKIK